MYTEYQMLHQDLEEVKLIFHELEIELQTSTNGTEAYDVRISDLCVKNETHGPFSPNPLQKVRNRIIEEYKARQHVFQTKKRKYYHLDDVLKHIKKLVHEYDAANVFV